MNRRLGDTRQDETFLYARERWGYPKNQWLTPRESPLVGRVAVNLGSNRGARPGKAGIVKRLVRKLGSFRITLVVRGH